MTFTRELLDKVRIQGKIGIPSDGPIGDSLPVIYNGNDQTGVPFYNSGGRSLLIERDGNVYKINGVDPHGHLTERVSLSRENRLSDVVAAHHEGVSQRWRLGTTFNGKPFGVYTKQNAERAREAFGRLNQSYAASGFVPPCDFTDSYPIDADSGTYQLLFGLPSIESDIRLAEVVALMEDRLAAASREELCEKVKYVNRFFGRAAAWLGYAMETLLQDRLVPTTPSWVTSNMVLHYIGNGYGIFRVDHTSTVADDEKSLDKFSRWIGEGPAGDAFFPLHNFSFYPEAAQIGALFPEVADKLPNKELPPFARVIAYYTQDSTPREAITDVRPIINVQRATFDMGRCFAGKIDIRALAIPEEYLAKIFE